MDRVLRTKRPLRKEKPMDEELFIHEVIKSIGLNQPQKGVIPALLSALKANANCYEHVAEQGQLRELANLVLTKLAAHSAINAAIENLREDAAFAAMKRTART